MSLKLALTNCIESNILILCLLSLCLIVTDKTVSSFHTALIV